MLWVGFESGTLVLCSVPSSCEDQLRYNWFLLDASMSVLSVKGEEFCDGHCLSIPMAFSISCWFSIVGTVFQQYWYTWLRLDASLLPLVFSVYGLSAM